MAWTDQRLEERFDGIDLRFDGVDRRFDETDRRLTELVRKLDWRFDETNRRFDETDRRIGNVEAGMRDLQNLLSRVGTGIIVSLFGVIAAILVKGG